MVNFNKNKVSLMAGSYKLGAADDLRRDEVAVGAQQGEQYDHARHGPEHHVGAAQCTAVGPIGTSCGQV